MEAGGRSEQDPAVRTEQPVAVRPVLDPPLTRLGRRTFDLSHRVLVMGIVNRTPYSFYDRGATFALERAVQAAELAVAEGADWIDIGGVPFGPGDFVSPAEEIDRVAPVVEAVAKAADVIISVDTTRSEVAEAAYAAGAHLMNDTSGLHDPQLAATAARHDGGLVLVHSVKPPRVPVGRASYRDVVGEVSQFLRQRIAMAEAAGVAADRLVIDPGHDLNKNTLHSLELTRCLAELAGLGRPLLVAVSNKDFIGESLQAAIEQRLAGSLAAAVFCVLKGARVLRVHNVAETVAAVRTVEAILGWRVPTGLRHNMGAPTSGT